MALMPLFLKAETVVPPPVYTDEQIVPATGLTYQGDILPYLQSASSISVPDGIYSVGPVATKGVMYDIDIDRGSWVTVQAATAPDLTTNTYNVVVDMTLNQSSVNFKGTGVNDREHRALYVGMGFTGGPIRFESAHRLTFWYTGHEYWPKQWYDNAWTTAQRVLLPAEIPPRGVWSPDGIVDAGGPIATDPEPRGGLYSIPHTDPRWETIRQGMGGTYTATPLRLGEDGGAGRHIRFLGIDIYAAVDDGIYADATFNLTVQGFKIRNIDEMYWRPDGMSIQPHEDAIGLDPGPVVGNEGDQWHNDGLQDGSGGWRYWYYDGWSTRRRIFNKICNPSKTDWDNDHKRIWMGPSIHANSQGIDQVQRLSQDPNFADWETLGDASLSEYEGDNVMLIAWGPTRGNTEAMMTMDIEDVVFIAQPGQNQFTYSSSATPSTVSGVTMTNITQTNRGKGQQELFLSDSIVEISQDPANPANIWRAANPYNTFATHPYAGTDTAVTRQ